MLYYYTVLLYCITMQYYYTVLLYYIIILYYYTVLLCCIIILYYYTVLLCCITMLYYNIVLLYCIIILYYYAVLQCCIAMLYKRVCVPEAYCSLVHDCKWEKDTLDCLESLELLDFPECLQQTPEHRITPPVTPVSVSDGCRSATGVRHHSVSFHLLTCS